MISEESILDTFLKLCGIYSPSFKEKAIIEHISARLAEWGIASAVDGAGAVIGGETGNLIAKLEGSGEGPAVALLFDAHVDTVEPALGVRPVVKGDIVTSAGDTILGADDKAGVAVLMEVARILKRERLNRGAVYFAFTVAEEQGLLGAKHLDVSSLSPDFIFTLDADGPVGSMVMRSPTHERIFAEFFGRSAHAGVEPEKGINAIQAAAKGIARLKLGRIDDETTANVGKIEGGLASNIIPGRAKVVAEARSFDSSKLKAVVSEMKRAFESGAEEIGAEVKMEVSRDYDSYEHGPTEPIVQLAEAAARSLGIEPTYTISGGGSNANVYIAKGTPALNLGLEVGKVHSTDEYASVSSMARLAELVIEIVKASAGFSSRL